MGDKQKQVAKIRADWERLMSVATKETGNSGALMIALWASLNVQKLIDLATPTGEQ